MLRSWDDFGVSIFSRMSEEARRADAINLAQGFPDFDGPRELIDEAVVALRSGCNQYAPSQGLRDLRLAVARSVEQRRQMSYDADKEVCIFSGATEALFCAVMALCQRGDELLTFEPYYDIYPGFALAAGAQFKTVVLEAPHWTLDTNALARAITPQTKVILLNTPNNPSGKVFSRDELAAIAELACKHNLFVITDEVYEELVFAPYEHHSLARLAGMRERTVVISSASKTFSITGWKIGYACAPASIIQRMRTIHEHTTFCSASPLQKAAIKAFQLPASYFEELRQDYAQKEKLLRNALEGAGFRCLPTQGTYFIVADYSVLSNLDDEAFALWLTREIKVACIPLSAFFQDRVLMKQKRLVRFCFAKKAETLKASAERLLIKV